MGIANLCHSTSLHSNSAAECRSEHKCHSHRILNAHSDSLSAIEIKTDLSANPLCECVRASIKALHVQEPPRQFPHSHALRAADSFALCQRSVESHPKIYIAALSSSPLPVTQKHARC